MSDLASTGKIHTPAELHALARRSLQEGNLEAAQATLGIAFELDENDAEAMCIMADLLEEAGEKMEAVGYAVLAINTDDTKLAAKKKFLRLAHDMSFSHYNDKVESALLKCLHTPGLECGGANVLWGNTLLINPQFGELFIDIVKKRLLPWGNPFDDVKDFSPLMSPLFLKGMQEIVVCFLPFENFLTHLRRFLLEQKPGGKLKPQEHLALSAAVARFSFFTDYILDVTDKEQKAVNTLKEKVETQPDAASIALLGAYEPLYALKNAAEIEKNFSGPGETGDLVRLQITEWRKLQEKAKEVQAATAMGDAVAEKVKDMYEQFPYPRWREMEETQFNWRDLDAKVLDKPGTTALVAGCGTGRESCQLAAKFPQAEVLAVDITRASLAYGMLKAEQYNLKNLTYRQADIMKLAELGKKFDYIHCVGVLHHMSDPEAGWEVLTSLLKPGGVMHIGLYGETPRRSIVAARAAVKKGGYGSTAPEMRRFRRDSQKLLSQENLATLMKARDYYFLSMYSDLLFHVHEDRFTLPRVQAALEKQGLQFLGFKLSDDVMKHYRELFPDDPKGLVFANWAEFERHYPDTFIHSYKFWCKRKGE